ncbi:6-phosphogluconate dehydrogenase [Candidatus Carsonella ruddii HT isolate Thao2000]|uniref:6-phosphogluconate dehydrogenase n=1 Tax=Candidatus Carsonella ruddii HT isolate Thao2000 TaxID=1202539 RepID=J3TW91_CARRU|nr:NAD(P)-binding domain-containing protein [Candidatus Carsonella ruddii]AFP84085.1 6-phosphogluconate dehydrogenase [Candidatus Carsonella ruddii HT isolate Thao2000]
MINHIGIIGYGVMSKNITINLIKKNIFISIYNKEKIKLKLKFFNIVIITNCLKKFLLSLPKTKILIILIKTGLPIKIILIRLKKKLSKNDIVIDFGNSFYKNTYLNNLIINKKFIFISSGISGGSLGALNGLCCMIDCNIKQYILIKNILNKILFFKKKRYSCCISIGKSSSHYIKMVHNGIEYGILQLISEIYYIIKVFLKYKKYIINVLLNWVKTNINCYLLKILINILIIKKKNICDIIEQKGTGRNTVLNSLNNEININTIFEALIIRIISKNIFFRNLLLLNNKNNFIINYSIFLEKIKNFFFFCKLQCYIQGFNQIIKIKKKYNWKLNFNNLIKTYLNSCIIDSNALYYLINFKKNFFLLKIFYYYLNKFNLFKKIIIIFLKLNLLTFFLCSSYNFLLILINKNYNFKIIQMKRNFFGNHLIKYL